MQKFNFVGWNISEIGIRNKPYLKNHIRNLVAPALVIDSDAFCQDLLQVTPLVIDRRSTTGGIVDNGNSHWSRMTAEEQYDQMISQSPNRNTVKHLDNECTFNSYDELVAYGIRTARIGELASKDGYRMVLMNTTTGSERWEWIKALDPVIKVIARYPDNLFWGAHWYAPWSPTLDVGKQTYLDFLEDPKKAMAYEAWAKVKEFNPRVTWHFFRNFMYTNIRAEQLGFKPLFTFITEMNTGKTSDIPQHVYDQADAMYPSSAGVSGLNGWRSLDNLYRDVFPNDTPERVRTKMIRWVKSMCPANILAVLIYCAGAGEEDGHNHEGDVVYMEELEKEFSPTAQKPPAEYPTLFANDSRWRSIGAIGADPAGARIRTFPTTDSKQISSISGVKPRTGLKYIPDEKFNDGEFFWYPVLFKIGKANTIGWVREDVVKWL